MLEVDAGTRRRFTLFLAVFGLFLGGMMLSGLAQRFSGNLPGNGASEISVDEAREEVRKTRAARDALAKLGHQGKWAEAIALAESRLQEGERPLIRFLHSEALIRSGRFPEAVAAFDRSLRGGDYTIEAARLTYVGDKEGYRKFCETAAGQLADATADLNLKNNTAWLCALMPGGLKDYTRPLELARTAAFGAEDSEDRWIFLNTLGVVSFRAGQYSEAITHLRAAEKLHPDPFNWPFLALAYHRTGDRKQAVYWRDRFVKRLTATYATNDLSQSRHELLLFYREIEKEMGFGGG